MVRAASESHGLIADANAKTPRSPGRFALLDRIAKAEANQRLTIAFVALSLGLLAAFQVVYLNRGFVPGDAFNYLGAAERLNAGHDLYALAPGDRSIPLQPPTYTVPFLYPPPIAVFWRPLALLGDVGAYVWWAIGVGAITAVLATFYRRRPLITALAVMALVLPLTYELGVGNVNPLLLAGLVSTWYLARAGRDRELGIIVAAMIAVKLTPVVLLWWLLVVGRPRAIGWALIVGSLIAAVSVVGAGIGAHLRYLEIVGQMEAFGSSEGSLGGIARTIGMPADLARILPGLVALTGLVLVWATRRRPDVAYVLVVLTMVLGSPVININWPSLFLALLAPVVWPLAGGVSSEREPQVPSTPLLKGAVE